MDLFAVFDPLMKGMTTATGLGLIGLMLVRTTPRGQWKIVGLEGGPLFEKDKAWTGKLVGAAFAICVALVMVRTMVAVF